MPEQGDARRLRPGEIAPRYTLLSTRADRALGMLRVGVAAGMMRENGSVLGARFGSRVNHCAVRGSAKVHGKQTHNIISALCSSSPASRRRS